MPTTTTPTQLDADALARRLAELAAGERAAQVEFLLHLEEFDRRQAWLEAGYGSLWEYCLRVLHLREGAAARRIRAMRVLRRVPDLAEALRDGRLCLTTVGLLDPLLTGENVAALVGRAAHKTKAEVEELVVSLRPRIAPRDGLRRLAERREEVPALPFTTSTSTSAATPTSTEAAVLASTSLATSTPASLPSQPARPTVRPVAADTWSLRVTVDAAFKQELEQLAELLSHKLPGGDLSAVLREAVHCAIERHGKRKGAVEPARRRERKAPKVAPAAPSKDREPVTAEVRRQVWRRDEGRCAWTSPDGHRCGSRWRVEIDHIDAAALGGPSTPENLRLTCAAHDRLHAEKTFGRAFMGRFRRRWPRTGGPPAPGDSGFFAPAPE
jgi:5-methylcytosine-specific restriction endonuclease McrA